MFSINHIRKAKAVMVIQRWARKFLLNSHSRKLKQMQGHFDYFENMLHHLRVDAQVLIAYHFRKHLDKKKKKKEAAKRKKAKLAEQKKKNPYGLASKPKQKSFISKPPAALNSTMPKPGETKSPGMRK